MQKEWHDIRRHTYSIGVLTFHRNPKKESKFVEILILNTVSEETHVVGPCPHGMVRPQVADRGTVSDKEGSCE